MFRSDNGETGAFEGSTPAKGHHPQTRTKSHLRIIPELKGAPHPNTRV